MSKAVHLLACWDQRQGVLIQALPLQRVLAARRLRQVQGDNRGVLLGA